MRDMMQPPLLGVLNPVLMFGVLLLCNAVRWLITRRKVSINWACCMVGQRLALPLTAAHWPPPAVRLRSAKQGETGA